MMTAGFFDCLTQATEYLENISIKRKIQIPCLIVTKYMATVRLDSEAKGNPTVGMSSGTFCRFHICLRYHQQYEELPSHISIILMIKSDSFKSLL